MWKEEQMTTSLTLATNGRHKLHLSDPSSIKMIPDVIITGTLGLVRKRESHTSRHQSMVGYIWQCNQF